jgi:shikimate kinase
VERVLLTGMSGTGKSTLIGELAARGYKAVDVDCDAFSEWVEVSGDADPFGQPVDRYRDWVWREDRIQDLLDTEDAEVLFLSGCAENMGKFLPQFDYVVLLSAPSKVLVERLATRTTNPFGKRPDEVARVLGLLETVEPLLRRAAGVEIFVIGISFSSAHGKRLWTGHGGVAGARGVWLPGLQQDATSPLAQPRKPCRQIP